MISRKSVIVICYLAILALTPSIALADMGEGFLYVTCNPEEEIFEVQPVVIWNDELMEISPALEQGHGAIKKGNHQLISVESSPYVHTSCQLGDKKLDVSFDVRGGDQGYHPLTVHENNKTIISLMVGDEWYSSTYVYKARHTPSAGWEEFCSTSGLGSWEKLDSGRKDTKCDVSAENNQKKKHVEAPPSVAEILLADGTLKNIKAEYKTVASNSAICDPARDYLNGKITGIRDLYNRKNTSGKLTLPDGKVLGKGIPPRLFDFDNDGKEDRVFYYFGAGSYLSGNLLYIDFKNNKEDLTSSDVKIFPCQFDPSVTSSSSCPTISQKADEAGIKVSIGKAPEVFFRGRYTSITPVSYEDKTYLILFSASEDTKYYSAVIYPFEETKYTSLCLFER